MKKFIALILIICASSSVTLADKYTIDTSGMHASIQFKASHLGYSWLWGRFNDFKGVIDYDKEHPENSNVQVTINTKSIDTNHALRDKHLKGSYFLHVKKFPTAEFVSTSFELDKEGNGVLKGNFTLRNITLPIAINIHKLGEGDDPWGGYRIGFEGSTRIALLDYGIEKDLGPATKALDLIFSIEAIRQ